jgi:hypothetical protein
MCEPVCNHRGVQMAAYFDIRRSRRSDNSTFEFGYRDWRDRGPGQLYPLETGL